MDLNDWPDDQRVALKPVKYKRGSYKAKLSNERKTYKEKKTTEAKPTKTSENNAKGKHGKHDKKVNKTPKKAKNDKQDKKNKKGKTTKKDNAGNKDKKYHKAKHTAKNATTDTHVTTDNHNKTPSTFADKVAKRARRAESPPAHELAPNNRIKVGSDCSGYCSDHIALTLLGVDCELVFVAELDAGKRELLKAANPDVNFSRTIVYHDITKRNNEEAPYVDLFCSGAPCQPWSQAGEKKGLDDLRGCVIFHSLEYVRCKRPRTVLFENVKGLTIGKNKLIFDQFLNALKDLGYAVEWRVLDTKEHGVPQSRPRVFIVGIRARHLTKSIEFPSALRRVPPLESFLNVDDHGAASDRPTGKCFTAAIAKAENKYGKKLDEVFVVVDVGSSERFTVSMVGCCPCITKSRGRSCNT